MSHGLGESDDRFERAFAVYDELDRWRTAMDRNNRVVRRFDVVWRHATTAATVNAIVATTLTLVLPFPMSLWVGLSLALAPFAVGGALVLAERRLKARP